jgi:serine/threonine protein kinase
MPDCRSDLYGLGATLYALLTGRPPVEADSLPTLISKIREEMPQSPRTYQLAINERFSDLVMHLIEKRPEDRYQTPAALLKDLETVGSFNNLAMD